MAKTGKSGDFFVILGEKTTIFPPPRPRCRFSNYCKTRGFAPPMIRYCIIMPSLAQRPEFIVAGSSRERKTSFGESGKIVGLSWFARLEGICRQGRVGLSCDSAWQAECVSLLRPRRADWIAIAIQNIIKRDKALQRLRPQVGVQNVCHTVDHRWRIDLRTELANQP